jgi:hypothetical protein
MSSVELGDFFESGGYFVHVATAHPHGAWLAWAEFKQDLEVQRALCSSARLPALGARGLHLPGGRCRNRAQLCASGDRKGHGHRSAALAVIRQLGGGPMPASRQVHVVANAMRCPPT